MFLNCQGCGGTCPEGRGLCVDCTSRTGDSLVDDGYQCYRTVQAIERYGKEGMVVSIVFGKCGDRGCLYSVSVMDQATGIEFEHPFGSHDFKTIAEILENEVPKILQPK